MSERFFTGENYSWVQGSLEDGRKKLQKGLISLHDKKLISTTNFRTLIKLFMNWDTELLIDAKPSRKARYYFAHKDLIP